MRQVNVRANACARLQPNRTVRADIRLAPAKPWGHPAAQGEQPRLVDDQMLPMNEAGLLRGTKKNAYGSIRTMNYNRNTSHPDAVPT